MAYRIQPKVAVAHIFQGLYKHPTIYHNWFHCVSMTLETLSEHPLFKARDSTLFLVEL